VDEQAVTYGNQRFGHRCHVRESFYHPFTVRQARPRGGQTCQTSPRLPLSASEAIPTHPRQLSHPARRPARGPQSSPTLCLLSCDSW